MLQFGLTFLGDIIVGVSCFVCGMVFKNKTMAFINGLIAKVKAKL